jgi:hypothetical protein
MTRVTLGKLVLETAQGQEKERSIPAEDVQELHRNISERVTPKIEEIREKQRRALEESKPIVLL